jgi:hypothetical protein
MPRSLKSFTEALQSDTEALCYNCTLLKRINKKIKKVVDNAIVFWYHTKCQQVVDGKANKEGNKHEKSYFVHVELYYLYGNADVYSIARQWQLYALYDRLYTLCSMVYTILLRKQLFLS